MRRTEQSLRTSLVSYSEKGIRVETFNHASFLAQQVLSPVLGVKAAFGDLSPRLGFLVAVHLIG